MASTTPRTRVLTGITTSGTPHLGNYVGAIRPAIAASRDAATESFYFLADYHALIKVQEPTRVQRSTLEIAAAWLACGLDPAKVWFYRQSDVPEIPELTWLLTCVAGKGLLNRAHAYKAAVDKNRAEQVDDDAGVTAGLFMYPVLMAADILLFNANKVPVGRDQVQHIEMARDFGQRFNHLYGEHFALPEAAIEEHVATLPGLDGRKMSKSYDNTIPLFAPRDELHKLIYSIRTDLRGPGEPKDTAESAVFQLYRAFASASQTLEMRNAFQNGISWGEAKSALFSLIDSHVAPLRANYKEIVSNPLDLEITLRRRAEELRETYAIPLMREVKSAVGLRPLQKRDVEPKATSPDDSRCFYKRMAFKGPFPDPTNGTWMFRIEDIDRKADALHSRPFNTREDVGRIFKELKRGNTDGFSWLVKQESGVFVIYLMSGNNVIAEGEGDESGDVISQKLSDLREFFASLEAAS